MKLTITANAYSLTSTIKAEEISLLKKYNPDALKIKDEDNNVKFAIDYCEGRPSVAPFGIAFSGTTLDDNRYVTLTGEIPSDIKTAEGAKGYLADQFGGVIAYLSSLEESVAAACEAVKSNRQAIMDSITIA